MTRPKPSARYGYAILSGLCILGAVALALTDKPDAQFVALLGLGGTLAGRGK